MANFRIRDGRGSKKELGITGQHEALVAWSGVPPLLVQKQIIFRQYFTDDGTATGDNDMRVDGSTTSQDFYISADGDDDRYITTLNFVIADAGAGLNEFGGITALTNGCDLLYETLTRTVTIADELKSNWDFIRLAGGTPPIGDTTNAFRANNVVGASEAYIPVIDLTKFVPPYGIKLERGTTQRIIIRINDNTSAIDGFDCIAYGFDRFE